MTKKRGKQSDVPNKMKVHYRLKITLNSIKHNGMNIAHNGMNMKHNELNKIPYRFNILRNKIYRQMYFELDIVPIEKLVGIN